MRLQDDFIYIGRALIRCSEIQSISYQDETGESLIAMKNGKNLSLTISLKQHYENIETFKNHFKLIDENNKP